MNWVFSAVAGDQYQFFANKKSRIAALIKIKTIKKVS